MIQRCLQRIEHVAACTEGVRIGFVDRDERAKEAQYRAGFNAFWSVVLVPTLYVAFFMFIPTEISEQIAQWGGFELAWPLSLICGFVVYLGSVAYYRVSGLYMPVENELKVYRAKYDLTQEELAIEMDVSRQTINAIETRKYNPSLELVLKLADHFDVATDDLF